MPRRWRRPYAIDTIHARRALRRTGTAITVLGRSNKTVLLAAGAYVEAYYKHGDRKPFLYVRGTDMGKMLRMVEQLEDLKNSGAVGTFGEDTLTYAEFARLHREEAIDDPGLCRAIEMVEATPSATAVVRGIHDMSVSTPEDARVILSTVHQMKGLESGAVRLLDDVATGVVDGAGRAQKVPEATLCLVYTALSRAIGDLYVPESLWSVWSQHRRHRG